MLQLAMHYQDTIQKLGIIDACSVLTDDLHFSAN